MAEAERFARRALEVATSAASPAEVAAASGHLAEILERRGGAGAAEEVERLHRLQIETLTALHGPRHSSTAIAKGKLGYFLGNQQRDAEAVGVLEEVVDICRTLYGPNHARTCSALSNLTISLADIGELDRAQAAAEAAVAGLRASNPGGLALADALGVRASVATRKKEYAVAESCHREALAIREEKGSVNVTTSMANLASALKYQGKFEEAAEYSWKAIERRRASGNLFTDFGVMLNNHADLLARIGGRDEEAEKLFLDSLEFDKANRPGNPANALNLRGYVAFLVTRGRAAEAEPLAREAFELTSKQPKAQRTRVVEALVSVLESIGKGEEAGALRAEFGLSVAGSPATASPRPESKE
jgi:tetratricopeptide (TPR) repeat protein